MMLSRIREEVPKSPGCYLYFNVNNDVIYVGKAKNLRNRMSSYFNKSHDLKTQKLVSEIADFKFYVTNSESESLILERNLITKYNPRYNIALKDDKSYPYIVVTNEKYSRILKVRNKKLSGEYFGPFPNVNFVNDVIEMVNKQNKLRVCNKVPNVECLYYHIGQCYAPCINKNSDLELKYKQDALMYFRNGMKKTKELASIKMNEAAEKMDFEGAQKYRDIVFQIDANKKRQAVQLNQRTSFDVVAYYKDTNWIAISVLSVVDGIVNNINLSMHPYYDDYQTSIVSYMFNYYENEQTVPLLVKDDELGSLLSNVLFTEAINSHLSEYRSLEEMAEENAKVYFKNNIENITKMFYKGKNEGFSELQKIANSKLNKIEMIDISHHQGSSQVAGKIVYIDGVKTPKLYRKYKIKEASKRDEYGSMREVIERSIKRQLKNNEILPDLLVVDGGKQQVNVAIDVLRKYNVDDKIKLIGLVKDDKHTTSGIINKDLQVLTLDKKSELYSFLYKMQEEVHRYAIDFHKLSQKNSTLSSVLDEIEGVGKTRKRLLYDKFKTIEVIKSQSVEQLVECGIPENIAKNIYNYFNDK